MLKSMIIATTAVAAFGAAWLLLPIRGHEAAAQSGPLHISSVDIDIVPGELDVAATANMIAKRDARAFSSVAMYAKGM
jgi:hypothetical protein